MSKRPLPALDPREALRAMIARRFAALENSATDPTVEPAVRAEAAAKLAQERAAAQMEFANMIAGLAGMIEDENADPEARAGARRDLQERAEQMRTEGDDIAKWIAPKSQTRQ